MEDALGHVLQPVQVRKNSLLMLEENVMSPLKLRATNEPRLHTKRIKRSE